MPVMDYIINYNYIVKELCENVAKPQMHCNGKCHLMKELAKAAETEKPLTEKKAFQSASEVLFMQPDFPLIDIQNYSFHNPENTTQYSNLYFHIGAAAIFHPPAVIS